MLVDNIEKTALQLNLELGVGGPFDSIVSQSPLSLDLELDFFGPRFGLSNLDFWLTKKFKVCSPRNNIFFKFKNSI